MNRLKHLAWSGTEWKISASVLPALSKVTATVRSIKGAQCPTEETFCSFY